MPLFDRYTRSILLEALSNPGSKNPQAPRISKIKKAGGFGGGPAALTTAITNQPTYTGNWSGTTPAPGTQMPSGADIPSQVAWGKYKTAVDPAIDYYLGKIPILGKDPLVNYGVKQWLKTELATRYLGGTSPTTSLLSDLIGGAAGPGLKAIVDSPAIKNTLSSLIGAGPGSLATSVIGAPTNRFGNLGQKVSEKLPQLALMGIDPLDWATKAFGADAAAEHIENIPRQTMAATSAGGYLQKGKSRGIY